MRHTAPKQAGRHPHAAAEDQAEAQNHVSPWFTTDWFAAADLQASCWLLHPQIHYEFNFLTDDGTYFFVIASPVLLWASWDEIFFLFPTALFTFLKNNCCYLLENLVTLLWLVSHRRCGPAASWKNIFSSSIKALQTAGSSVGTLEIRMKRIWKESASASLN